MYRQLLQNEKNNVYRLHSLYDIIIPTVHIFNFKDNDDYYFSLHTHYTV